MHRTSKQNFETTGDLKAIFAHANITIFNVRKCQAKMLHYLHCKTKIKRKLLRYALFLPPLTVLGMTGFRLRKEC